MKEEHKALAEKMMADFKANPLSDIQRDVVTELMRRLNLYREALKSLPGGEILCSKIDQSQRGALN